jgi:hypothetical protein
MTNLLRVTCVTSVIVGICPLIAVARQATAQTESSTAAQGGQRGGRGAFAARANMPAPQGFSVVLVLGEMQGTGAADNVPPAARKALTDMKDFLPYKGYRLLDTQWTLCCGRSAIVTRLRGPEDQDYDLELEPNPTDTSGKWYVRFSLRNPLAGAARSEMSVSRETVLAQQHTELEAQLKSLQQRYNDNHPEVQKARARLHEIEVQQVQMRSESDRRRQSLASAGNRRTVIDTSFTMDIGETVVVGTSRLQGDKALIALLTAVASTKAATAR